MNVKYILNIMKSLEARKSLSEKFLCLNSVFGGNDQLKTNTALQAEAAKIEFKVI